MINPTGHHVHSIASDLDGNTIELRDGRPETLRKLPVRGAVLHACEEESQFVQSGYRIVRGFENLRPLIALAIVTRRGLLQQEKRLDGLQTDPIRSVDDGWTARL